MKAFLPLLLTLGTALFERRLKRVASGIGLLVFGAFFAMVAIVFLLMSIFFGFADMDTLIMPSLVTGGIILLIAFLVAFEGLRFIRK